MSDSLPTTGYADYRRTDDLTVDTLVEVFGAASTPTPTYGPFFVGQTPSLEISFFSGIQNHDLDIEFLSQRVGGASLALTNYTVMPGNTLRMRVPVYGPWVQLQAVPKGGTINGTHDLIAMTSRRISGSSMPLRNTNLLHMNRVSIPAASTDIRDIDQPYVGWAHWNISTVADSWSAVLQVRDRNDSVLSTLARVDNTLPGEDVQRILYIPPLIVQQRFRNSDAAAKDLTASLIPVFL